ncbi:MAG: hypothetical protein ABIH26_04020, partial [Candidatus Eisenbacteria bacterium]
DLGRRVAMGKAYYRFACSYTDHIPARHRSVTDVLAKLSYDFEKYRVILSHMRGAFLDLVEPLSGQDVALIRKDMDERERAEHARLLQDRLLDRFLEHQREPTEENRKRVHEMLRELRALDPGAWPAFSLEEPPGAVEKGPQ